MAIISVQFLLFAALVIALYFLLPLKCRPYWLLLSSIFFYASFDLTYFLYLGVTVITTFSASHLIYRAKNTNHHRLTAAIAIITVLLNAGILITVKFLGYTLSILGHLFHINTPIIAIPAALGIAFYTMQAIGYCADVYLGKYPPEKNFLKYLLFMIYFPIIMQGPISRYNQLADQLFTPHRFSFVRLKSGFSLILWGLFQKIVIADRAAIFANQVFNNYQNYAGFIIAIAVFLYTIQLYCDFSGFVDISRGISEILGIYLIRNFDAPYFADSIKDFWRRWHISLSSWFRDYIYIPLGGSRKGLARKYVNLIIVFLASGLWHGVGMHYIVWGLMQALFQIFGELTQGVKNKLHAHFDVDKTSFSFHFGKQLITFALVNLSWLFFRANSLSAAFYMLRSMISTWNPWVFFDNSLFQIGLDAKDWNVLIVSIFLLFVVNFFQQKFSIREKLEAQAFWFRYAVYLGAIFTILIFGIYGPGFDQAQFLYMQF